MPAGDLPDYTSAVVSPASFLEEVSVPPNATTGFFVVPPAGTTAILISPVGGPTTGVTVQKIYVTPNNASMALPALTDAALGGTAQAYPIAFDPNHDTGVWIDLTNASPTTAATVDFYALLNTEALFSGAGYPLKVAIVAGEGSGNQAVDIAAPLGQALAAASIPTVPTSDLPVGKQGQAAMAASLPVVVASDQSAVRSRRQAWDAHAVNRPATGSAASVTLPAPGANLRYQLDHLLATLVNTAAANGGGGEVNVSDSSGVIWSVGLGVTATAGASDHIVESDMCLLQSVFNAALTIGFGGALASWATHVAVGAYIVS